MPDEIRIQMTSGTTHVERVVYPKAQSLSDDDLDALVQVLTLKLLRDLQDHIALQGRTQ